MALPMDRLQVELTAKGCDIPDDERARLQASLEALDEMVRDFPQPALSMNAIYHPRSEIYNAEAKLKLPGRTIITGAKDQYMDTALQSCLRKVIQKAEAYKVQPDRAALAEAERLESLERVPMAPEAPDVGPLAKAAEEGDYQKFHFALGGYEEWLRLRIGRWVQRIPEAQAQLGDEILLGDLVEEVYLNAFEQFTRRPTAVPLSEWLESLIDPSIREMLRHPEEEAVAASLARMVRESDREASRALAESSHRKGEQ